MAVLTLQSHLRRIAALGLPLIGSQLAQYAIQLTDTLMLGRYAIDALAAQVLASSLFATFLLMGSGFAFAVLPIIAAAAVRGETRQVRRVTRMALWLSIGFGACCMPIFVLAGPIFRGLGQSEAIAAAGGDYLALQGWSIFPALGIMVLRSFLSALDRARIVLWTTLLAVAVNAAANYVLIFGNLGAPEMGLVGAAWASLLSTAAAFAAIAVYAARAFPGYEVFRNPLRPDPEALGRVLRLGWPIGLTILAEVGLFTAASVMMGWIDAVALAAHGIAMQIITAIFMVHVGLSQVATIRVGNALGSGDGAELRRGAASVLGVSMLVALLTILLFLAMPQPLVAAFLGRDEPSRAEVLSLGVKLLAAAAVFQLMDALQVMTLALLRGVEDTRVPMIVSVFSYWAVGAPMAWLLGFPAGLGGVGIWLGLACGLALAGAGHSWRFWRRGAYAVENGSAA